MEGNTSLRSYFISQSALAITHKLQNLEIEPDTPISRLVEVAYCMFKNRYIEEEKSEDKNTQRQAHLLAVALQCQPVSTGIWTNCPQRPLTLVSDHWPSLKDSKPRKLGPNQWAICKQEGQWKRECPHCLQRGTEVADPAHYPEGRWSK